MGSIVLADEERNFDCQKCLDSSVWKSQGRDAFYIAKRLKAKMIGKGCTSDAKQPVFRLEDGHKILRCPRALCDETNSLSVYADYSAINDGLYSYKKSEVTWKWASSMQTVRAELASNQKQRIRDINSKSKSKG